MATIAETRKLVDQYKKQLQTAMTKVRDQEADVKDLLKKQEQAEKDAKAEKKDANKKAGLEKAAQELEKKEKAATTFLGELKKAVALNEATVKKFETQLEKLEEGVKEFGKSEPGFLSGSATLPSRKSTSSGRRSKQTRQPPRKRSTPRNRQSIRATSPRRRSLSSSRPTVLAWPRKSSSRLYSLSRTGTVSMTRAQHQTHRVWN